ncbi:MAG: DMT family transporter [Erysipelotrichaceae bacterium]|nr:DMT family transporter [Erysipelotrichaceae bacterium]
MRHKQLFASFMLLVATMLWGLSYSVQSVSAADMGTYTIVFFKGIGGLFLLPLIFLFKQHFTKDAVLGGVLIGTCAFMGCALQQKGIELSGASKAGFITVLYIVIVPLIQLIRGEKISRKMIFAILIALVGLYFLCITDRLSFNIGDLYLLLGAVCFAMQIILIDHFVQKGDALVLSLVAQCAVALFSAILAFSTEVISLSAIRSAWLPICFIVFLSGAVAQTIQVVFQKDLEPGLASLLMSFESVFAAIFGWLLLQQTLTLKEIFGCFLVMIAIIIADE